MSSRDHREWLFDVTESETPSTHGNSMHGNRETPEVPPTDGAGGRSAKVEGRAADMYAAGESDDSIVPKKQANKAGPRPAAESAEGRGSAKGNARQTAACRAQDRISVSNGLEGVRRAARRDKGVRFTTLLKRKVNWVLDADIQGFFDAIDHEWLMKFVEHRIADPSADTAPVPGSKVDRYDLRQEPYEGNLHVRICAGGRPQGRFLPRR